MIGADLEMGPSGRDPCARAVNLQRDSPEKGSLCNVDQSVLGTHL